MKERKNCTISDLKSQNWNKINENKAELTVGPGQKDIFYLEKSVLIGPISFNFGSI